MKRLEIIRKSIKRLTIPSFLTLAIFAGLAQSPIGSGPGSTMPGQSKSTNRNPLTPDLDGEPSPFPDTSNQRRNSERQRRIVSDSERLVYLTNQLKTELAASSSERLTPEMLHQMDEIEKLARSVKDKMRN
jgi:hypothetical protein